MRKGRSGRALDHARMPEVFGILFFAAANGAPADEDEQNTRSEERIIKDGHAQPLDLVVEVQDVVSDDAFHQVKKPPTQNHRAYKGTRGPPHFRVLSSPPQYRDAQQGHQPASAYRCQAGARKPVASAKVALRRKSVG